MQHRSSRQLQLVRLRQSPGAKGPRLDNAFVDPWLAYQQSIPGAILGLLSYLYMKPPHARESGTEAEWKTVSVHWAFYHVLARGGDLGSDWSR
jgi:hypothetical protein